MSFGGGGSFLASEDLWENVQPVIPRLRCFVVVVVVVVWKWRLARAY